MQPIQRVLEILYATEVRAIRFHRCFIVRFSFFFQEGFAQPDQENGNGDSYETNGVSVASNGNGSALIGADEETY